MPQFAADLKTAWRALARAPGFTAAVALTLAVGIGALTAVFTLVNAIVLSPLPYPDADRLVVLRHTAPAMQLSASDQSDASYLHYKRHNRVFEDLGVYTENAVAVTGVAVPERVEVAMVDASLLSTLRPRFIIGRTFTEEEGREGSEVVSVLISEALWRRQYNSDPAIVGRDVRLNGRNRRVAGVVAAGFDFPRRETEVWYATETSPPAGRASDWYLGSVARMRPGVTTAEAEAELNRLLPGLALQHPDLRPLIESGLRARVEPLKDVVLGPARSALWLLFGGMALVLLIACANVANLLLVRAEQRQREMAVRVALGAGAAQLGRAFLSEALLLALVGGAAGTVLASVLVRLLVLNGPHNIPRLHEVHFDGRVLTFALLVALGVGIAFGLMPLFRKPVSLTSALKSGGHGSTADRTRARARGVLVALQVALALALLIASALLVQSFLRLRSARPGFTPDRVMALEINLPFTGYETYEKNAQFWQQVIEQVRALPGVEAAGAATVLPLRPYGVFALRTSELADAPAATLPKADFSFITDGYLQAMRMPLVRGEYPQRIETDDAPVLISAALANRLFPGKDPIGQRIRRTGDSTWNRVAAVVGDVPRTAIGGEPLEAMYVPVLERAVDDRMNPGHLTLVVRASGEPLSLVPALRNIVHSLDPDLALTGVQTLDRIVGDSMARTTLAMVLLLTAGVAALLLGVLGIYAVLAYTVSRRTRELGVRMALGARAADVQALVLRQTGRYVGSGVFAGLLVVLIGARLLRSLLYGVAPLDLTTMAGAVALVCVSSLAASSLPARRAARVDPIRALKVE